MTTATRHKYAWFTTAGRVFVEDYEIEQKLREKYPSLLTEEEDEEGMAYLDKCTMEQEKETFQELAEEKICAMYPTDESLKFWESSIDLSTYRS